MGNTEMTGIIPFTYFREPMIQAGSTFLRVDRLTANAPDFEKWIHGKKYDNLIFQKAYWIEMMKLFDGPMILDLCDPDWTLAKVDIIEMGNLVHAITCSSKELTNLMQGYFSDKIIEHVPDRIDFSIFPKPKEKHDGKAKNIVWFGYVNNAHETLAQLLPAIKKHDLRLRIIADSPYTQKDEILELQPDFVMYDQNTIYEELKKSDIILNPRSDRAFFRYKSNNKSLIAWKLGLPVAATCQDIDRFINPVERSSDAAEKQILVREYGIEKSAEQYRDIIKRIRERHF